MEPLIYPDPSVSIPCSNRQNGLLYCFIKFVLDESLIRLAFFHIRINNARSNLLAINVCTFDGNCILFFEYRLVSFIRSKGKILSKLEDFI